MNVKTILNSIKSLNIAIVELESVLETHTDEARKMIPFIVHDLHERMHKLKTASEHPSDFPSIVSTYSGHLDDFYAQVSLLRTLAHDLNVTSIGEAINTFTEFYLNQLKKKVKL